VQSRAEKPLAVVLSVLVHVALLGVLLVSLQHEPKIVKPPPHVEPVQATVVDEARITDELERIKQRDVEKKRREEERVKQLARKADDVRKARENEERKLAKLQKKLTDEKRRLENEAKRKKKAEAARLAQLKKEREAEAARVARLKKERAALAKKKRAEEARQAKVEAERKAEKKKKAEAERKRAEAQRRRAEEKKRKAEAEQRRQRAERELREQLALEQEAQEQANQRLRDRHLAEYISQIEGKVQRNWIQPTSAPGRLRAQVRVQQIPGGEVVQVTITRSSGNLAFDRSVETAVFKSSPLPQPKDPTLFDREINFEFDPEG
jgi:colicin import membrane protein